MEEESRCASPLHNSFSQGLQPHLSDTVIPAQLLLTCFHRLFSILTSERDTTTGTTHHSLSGSTSEQCWSRGRTTTSLCLCLSSNSPSISCYSSPRKNAGTSGNATEGRKAAQVMAGKRAHRHNHFSRVSSWSWALLTTIPSRPFGHFTRNYSCSACREGRDGLAALSGVLPPSEARAIPHAKDKIMDTKDNNFSAMAPVFMYRHPRPSETGQFLNLLQGWPLSQTGTSRQVTWAGFTLTGNFRQIIAHLPTSMMTTATFSFPTSPSSWHHKTRPAGDVCGAIGYGNRKLCRTENHGAGRTYSSMCPPQWSTSASSNCPATTGAMSTSIPSEKETQAQAVTDAVTGKRVSALCWQETPRAEKPSTSQSGRRKGCCCHELGVLSQLCQSVT